MCFDNKRTVNEEIDFDAHEMSFFTEITNSKVVSIIIRGKDKNNEMCDIYPNEESLREFHRKLTEVLKYIDEQRAVGKEFCDE